MTNGLIIAFGMIILAAGLLTFNTLPSFWSETQRLLIALVIFVISILIITAGVKGD